MEDYVQKDINRKMELLKVDDYFPKSILIDSINKQEVPNERSLVKGTYNIQNDPVELSIVRGSSQYVSRLQNKRLTLLAKLDRVQELETYIGPRGIDILKEINELESEDETGISPSQCFGYFVTINPVFENKDEKDIIQMLTKTAKKIASKTGISKALWCFEQTGKGETLGYHPHVHMVLMRNRQSSQGEPKRLKRNINDTIKRSFPDCKNKSIKPIKDGTESIRVKYITGNKSKPYDYDSDKAWRIKWNLNDVYQK